jgi:methionyl-tRNA synthetase
LEAALETFHFRDALKEAMNIARIGNKYISDTEPWKVAKTDMSRCATILNVSLQICADLALAFEPFTPFAAERLRNMLCVGVKAGYDHRAGEGKPTVNFYKAGEGRALHTLPSSQPEPQAGSNENAFRIVLDWEMLGSQDLLPEGHELGKPELLFSKVEDSVVEAQIAKLNAAKAANEEAAKAEAANEVEPQKAECSFDDFQKMDIRTATVLAAERVPKSDKLLKLSIDTGIDKRTIVSGIAKFYAPEDLVGKQICILANLKPRTIFGIESKGMILMAQQGDGAMRFITPQETLHNGSVIG